MSGSKKPQRAVEVIYMGEWDEDIRPDMFEIAAKPFREAARKAVEEGLITVQAVARITKVHPRCCCPALDEYGPARCPPVTTQGNELK